MRDIEGNIALSQLDYGRFRRTGCCNLQQGSIALAEEGTRVVERTSVGSCNLKV